MTISRSRQGKQRKPDEPLSKKKKERKKGGEIGKIRNKTDPSVYKSVHKSSPKLALRVQDRPGGI